MKNRFTLILSLTLVMMMCLYSCKTSDKSDDVGALEQGANTEVFTDEKQKDDTEKTDDVVSGQDVKNESPADEQQKTKDENPIYTGSISGSNRYISPEELQEIADMVFIGEYVGTSGQVIPDTEFLGHTLVYPVYTNHVFKTENVLKGEASDEVTIRCDGGTLDGVVYASGDTPHFEKGKKYLMYTYDGIPDVPNDTEYNYIITSHCFEIDDNGNAVFPQSKVKADDIPKLKAQYEQALAASVSKEDSDK